VETTFVATQISRDRAQILGASARIKPLVFHGWLKDERAIPRRLLLEPRFAGRIRVDFRASAVFPHADQDGPCGYEIKTGFARGGEKGLGFAAARAGDTALVIATDNDPRGRALGDQIQALVSEGQGPLSVAARKRKRSGS
jgi:Protein of unknown function (DUF3991)